MHATEPSSSWLWWLLPILPVAAVALLLAPPLGEREQGYLPELLAPGNGEAGELARLTHAVRWFAGTGFALSCLAGAAASGSLPLAWRHRLRTLDPRQASGFHALAYARLGWGALLAALLGSAVLALSPLRNLPAAWAGLPVSFALVAAGQCAATLFGVKAIRRLYRGGLP